MRRLYGIAVLAALVVAPLQAQVTELGFAYSIEDYPERSIIESLIAGHRSEVRYELRLFREVSGLRRIFGDTLIHREEITYVARWDPMNELYVVLIDGTQERTFKQQDLFLEFLLALNDHPLTFQETLTGAEYLLCRSRIQPIKLVPPLTLMTLIKSDLQTISDWNRIPFLWRGE